MATAATATLLSSEWLTQEETCKRLEKSISTVERLAASEAIASRIEPVPGRKGMRVYKAADVDRLAHQQQHTTRLVPAAAIKAPQSVQIQLPDEILQFARAIIAEREQQRLLRAPASRTENPQPVVPLDKKLWLSLDEAAAYSGLSARFLRDSIVQPEHYQPGENVIGIRAGRCGSWRIQRASLEAFAG